MRQSGSAHRGPPITSQRAGRPLERAGQIGADPTAAKIAALRLDALFVEPRIVDTARIEGNVVGQRLIAGRRLPVGRRSPLSRASPRLDALDWAPVLDSESHVEHDAAACHASDGVEVRLDHFRELPEQERKAQHQLAQRLSIEHGAAAEPVQLVGDTLGGVDQLVGFCVGDRQQAKRSRSGKAGAATAEADRQHWT